MELQFHLEGVVFPAKVRLLGGLRDATKQAEWPWSRGEVAEEGGRLDSRTKALQDEDVAIVGVTSEVGVHVGPDECGVGETEKFLVGRHGGRSGTTAVQPRRGVENQTIVVRVVDGETGHPSHCD